MPYLFLRPWLFVWRTLRNCICQLMLFDAVMHSLLMLEGDQTLDATTTGSPGVIALATTDKLQSSSDTVRTDGTSLSRAYVRIYHLVLY